MRSNHKVFLDPITQYTNSIYTMAVLLAVKKEMTQLFDQETGRVLPVTVLDVSNVQVCQQLMQGDNPTHIVLGKDTKRKPNKAEQGVFKKVGQVPAFIFAHKLDGKEEPVEVGTELSADTFEIGEKVDVTSNTKGKGFQGVVKRWGFSGGPKTHGQSDRHRAPGSIGSGTTPGRVVKGKKMGGHMGNVRQTVQNLRVVGVDVKNGLLMVKGAVPGPKGSYVVIRSARKSGK